MQGYLSQEPNETQPSKQQINRNMVINKNSQTPILTDSTLIHQASIFETAFFLFVNSLFPVDIFRHQFWIFEAEIASFSVFEISKIL